MQALLALEDGLILPARSFTGAGETSGEVIFNTGMTGYQEVLTDPSYVGQMVCMTYPLIGNYGINPDDIESERIRVEAFIVKECCKAPSNWRSVESLPDYLRRHDIVGIEGVDTRALTRHLRLHGAKRGVISTDVSDPGKLVERAKTIPTMEGQNLADTVTPSEPYVWTGSGAQIVSLDSGRHAWTGTKPRVVLFDFGVKWNILRLLTDMGFELLMVPSSFKKEQIDLLKPDAIFLSPGPGDPATLTHVIETIKGLTESYPIAGICLGHQLLGHALGGRTFKLKFGHHGCNHPVKDLEHGHIEISSQNHGFCVDIGNLSDTYVTHVNLNDNTLEGFAHKSKPIIAIQYHPEANPGPHDSRYFFQRYRKLVRDAAGV
jgi:carbamoyl-phosphate synthase small subunit